MSAPRLILKQPTGWFAAGREFAQALALVSDGAFKLYVHVCLSANRHTGRLATSRDELARAIRQSPERVATALAELEDRAVCSVTRHNGSNLAMEISDRFWPYQKQPKPGCTLGAEAEFVEKVRALFLAPACVQASFSAADEKIAVELHRRGVKLEQVGRAILLGSARKVCLDDQCRSPGSHHQPAILRRCHRRSDPLAHPGKLLETASRQGYPHGAAVATDSCGETLMLQPAG
jgi:hypothetical protein